MLCVIFHLLPYVGVLSSLQTSIPLKSLKLHTAPKPASSVAQAAKIDMHIKFSQITKLCAYELLIYAPLQFYHHVQK